MPPIDLTYAQALDTANLGLGVYEPLQGFVGLEDLHSVLETGRLRTGDPLGFPLLLNLEDQSGRILTHKSTVNLRYRGREVAFLEEAEFFHWDALSGLDALFGTASLEHPGVHRFSKFSRTFVGGRVVLKPGTGWVESMKVVPPAKLRSRLGDLSWKTVVGFQTRNVPHRAHEQLIRLALEAFDGVLVQPLVGPRKVGDFSEAAIRRGYGYLAREIFPKSRMMVSFLRARMMFGGPREAVLHAVIRKNYGCSHFIVGRDHAGVGSFYGRYEAQEYCSRFADDLGISILAWGGPYFCRRCDGIVSERSCRHSRAQDDVSLISGSGLRRALSEPTSNLDTRLVRPQVIEAARKGQLFVRRGHV